MNYSEKILRKMRQSPSNITIQEIIIFMKYKKIDLDRIRGSHFTFENALNGETITITSHNKKVKKIYIKKILKLIKNSNEKL